MQNAFGQVLDARAEVVAQEHGEFVEIATWIDISDFSDECDGVDEFVKWNEAVFELTDRRDHVAIELFFDESDIGADAEAAAEHDVVGMWACAARFVAELNAVDFDFL